MANSDNIKHSNLRQGKFARQKFIFVFFLPLFPGKGKKDIGKKKGLVSLTDV